MTQAFCTQYQKQFKFFQSKMYITPTEYLNLSERITLLKNKCDELHQDNQSLKQACQKQKETINLLEGQKKQLAQKQKEAKRQLAMHITQQAKNIQGLVQETNTKQQQYIQEQIIELSQDSNAKKLVALEQKMKQDKLQYDKYVQFHQKIKTLYHSCTKKKQSPSLDALFDWVEEGRKHEVVANDFTQGIVDLMFGTKLSGSMKSSKNLTKSMNKSILKKNDNKDTSVFCVEKSKRTQKTIKESSSILNKEEIDTNKQNAPKQLNFLEGIMKAAKQKREQNQAQTFPL